MTQKKKKKIRGILIQYNELGLANKINYKNQFSAIETSVDHSAMFENKFDLKFVNIIKTENGKQK